MQGNPKVLENLNKVLTAQLTAINQYFLVARIFKNWGISTLNSVNYKKSIKNMKLADDLIERVLFLEGLPNMSALNQLIIGEHTAEIMACNLQFQVDAMPDLREAIAHCEQVQDFVTRELLEGILSHEEDHLDWLETQHYQIDKIGIENYITANSVSGD
ncbi:bacterioferritin [Alginatibacterium sediminis]|uniref:Bacterioferritin n=1 Tax=Alginatibacterium sediminis TaxID=2164068 RepID=A0A420EDY7_9ALTE|nr:bacterioferritin [Alginatibacterium sediminis]RKF18883.1 bacterioferritin [Alginatibacterium sediminis]